ncbi:zinc dependent phospholipase C family protein [Cytophagaceae bacterium YF14B1]|uniref:Zinc dependent phospholipase C family protein n=2 Tax=Xanthocytophaga flava TaxID=3048013 RepID=A0AAE3QLP0_9BACT|nr:zinc dependent phospholipase C family protein [Xanthocytophaga flavus]
MFILFCITSTSFGWGFYAHKQINRLAVFGLPPEMISFYKHHIVFITENAVNPDRRRYIVPGEAVKHYIDMEAYGDSAIFKLPRNWKDAINHYTEDTLQTHGIVPWWVMQMKFQLTKAFLQRNPKRILTLSADIGHYIGDLNVPLHTTRNYNGQLTNQHGIHGLWEARIPELFSQNYDFWIGQAHYLYHPQQRLWQALQQANNAVDSVLRFEKLLSQKFSDDKKYSFEQRGATTQRVYSRDYVNAYHHMLNGQVERQMRLAIELVRDFWFTCWVDAGQPDLYPLSVFEFTPSETDSIERNKQLWDKGNLKVRPHENNSQLANPEQYPFIEKTLYIRRRRYYSA